jgi:hypothetical protein
MKLNLNALRFSKLTSNEKYNPKENCSKRFNEERKMYLTSSLFRKDDRYLTILKELEELGSKCFD